MNEGLYLCPTCGFLCRVCRCEAQVSCFLCARLHTDPSFLLLPSSERRSQLPKDGISISEKSLFPTTTMRTTMRSRGKKKARKNGSPFESRKLEDERDYLRDIHQRLNADIDSLTANVIIGRQLGHAFLDYSKLTAEENKLFSECLQLAGTFQLWLEDAKVHLCSLILEKIGIPLKGHIGDLKDAVIAKKKEALSAKEIEERIENARYDSVFRVCDYIEEYYNYFSKAKDKVAELLPTISKYRMTAKKYYEGEEEEEDKLTIGTMIKGETSEVSRPVSAPIPSPIATVEDHAHVVLTLPPLPPPPPPLSQAELLSNQASVENAAVTAEEAKLEPSKQKADASRQSKEIKKGSEERITTNEELAKVEKTEKKEPSEPIEKAEKKEPSNATALANSASSNINEAKPIELRYFGKVFGEDLQVVVKREGGSIPQVVEMLTHFLDEHGMHVQGIFRISGYQSQIQQYRENIDAGRPVVFPPNPKTVHIVCGLLKLYLRLLPEPLMTNEHFDEFTAITRQVIEAKRLAQLQELIQSLPPANAHLLDYIIGLCIRVTENSDKNKMNVKNMASLIAPNILYRKEPNPATLLDDINSANIVVEHMIIHYEKLFENIRYDKKIPLKKATNITTTQTPPQTASSDAATSKANTSPTVETVGPIPPPLVLSETSQTSEQPQSPASSGSPKLSSINDTEKKDTTMATTPVRRVPGGRMSKNPKQKLARSTVLLQLTLIREEEFLKAIDELFVNTNLSGWIVLGYHKPNEIELQAKGRGSVDELLAHLYDDQIQYCLIRLSVPDQELKISARDVFIEWNGPNVPQIEKGKKKSHLGEIKELLQPYHSELVAVSRERFNLETVLERSSPFSGSHVIDFSIYLMNDYDQKPKVEPLSKRGINKQH
jgi:hypothetical protein